jgi:hypothetical protein
MMLILSFLAVTVACVLLWLELNSYGSFPQWKVSGASGPSASLTAPAWDLDLQGNPLTQIPA